MRSIGTLRWHNNGLANVRRSNVRQSYDNVRQTYDNEPQIYKYTSTTMIYAKDTFFNTMDPR